MKYPKVTALKCGEVYIDKALSFRTETCHPAPYTGWFRREKNKEWVPVSAYLIEHPIKGNVLVDTGWHKEVREKPRKHLSSLLYSMFKPRLQEGESVDEQLKAKGILPKELEYVILTHLHADHVSGLQQVKEAKKILVSELEMKSTKKSLSYKKTMWENTKVETFEFEPIPFGPSKMGLDLFGDEMIYLVYTPGHSEGMVSVLVNTDRGWVVIGADVGYSKKSIENMTLPGLMTNKSKAYESLNWLKSFSERNDFHEIFFNHDPESLHN